MKFSDRESRMPQPSSGHVFISYSRKDDIVTRRIVIFLRKQGIKAWVDNEKLTPGTPVWEVEIEKAIKNASAIIVVLSPDSKNSEWVRREISLGDQYKKRVFPVLVSGDQETSISLRLINRQFVDLRVNEDAGLVSLETALAEYLKELNTQDNKVEIETQKQAGKKTRQQATRKPDAQIANVDLRSDNTTAFGLDNQSILWVTLGWTIGGLFGGFIYSSFGDMPGWISGGAIGGAIGGFVTSMSLRFKNDLSTEKNILKATLVWAIGGAIGWSLGWGLTEAVGAGIGIALFAMIGMTTTLKLDYVFSNWKNIALITLTWAISGAAGWSISRGLIEGSDIDKAIGWAIGTAIGWTIGGFFMIWQLTRK